MAEFTVVNNSTYIQYKVVEQNGEHKVYSMNGSEAKISYTEIESGLANGTYKKL